MHTTFYTRPVRLTKNHGMPSSILYTPSILRCLKGVMVKTTRVVVGVDHLLAVTPVYICSRPGYTGHLLVIGGYALPLPKARGVSKSCHGKNPGGRIYIRIWYIQYYIIHMMHMVVMIVSGLILCNIFACVRLMMSIVAYRSFGICHVSVLSKILLRYTHVTPLD